MRPAVPPFAHKSVLLSEAVGALAPRPGGRYVDATAGGGGYTRRLLDLSAPDGVVWAFDRDPRALVAVSGRLAGEAARCTLIQDAFGTLATRAAAAGIARSAGGRGFDGIVADLGVSTPQLDAPERGFSLLRDGPLDMRMGDTGPSAATLLDTLDEEALARVFYRFGEIRRARALARACKEGRARGALRTTTELADLCVEVLGRARSHHPATLAFQALRIAVNDELGELDRLLDALPDVLADGGVAAVVTFHSLEDRVVKLRFRALSSGPAIPAGVPVRGDAACAPFRVIKDRTASSEECAANPRARSARLRVLVRQGGARG